MTHPGVGPITALAFVLVIGSPERFNCGKQVGSYLGLIPCEESSSERWRLGHITKQGNKLLRFLLGQSAQSVARCEEQWHRQYAHLSMRRNKLIAKVAMARKLAVRLYWKLREAAQPVPPAPMQGSPAVSVVGESLSCFSLSALPPLERERGVRTGESWSVVEDRIDGWWEADFPRRIQGEESWSHAAKESRARTKLRLVQTPW